MTADSCTWNTIVLGGSSSLLDLQACLEHIQWADKGGSQGSCQASSHQRDYCRVILQQAFVLYRPST